MNHDMVEEDRYDEVVKKPGDEKETPLGLAGKVSNDHCPEFRWKLSLDIVHRSHACEDRLRDASEILDKPHSHKEGRMCTKVQAPTVQNQRPSSNARSNFTCPECYWSLNVER